MSRRRRHQDKTVLQPRTSIVKVYGRGVNGVSLSQAKANSFYRGSVRNWRISRMGVPRTEVRPIGCWIRSETDGWSLMGETRYMRSRYFGVTHCSDRSAGFRPIRKTNGL